MDVLAGCYPPVDVHFEGLSVHVQLGEGRVGLWGRWRRNQVYTDVTMSHRVKFKQTSANVTFIESRSAAECRM